jgi:hypothetical protein
VRKFKNLSQENKTLLVTRPHTVLQHKHKAKGEKGERHDELRERIEEAMMSKQFSE